MLLSFINFINLISPKTRSLKGCWSRFSLSSTSLSLRIGRFAHRGPLSAQRGSASQRADRGRPPDAQQRPAQPDGHRGRPGGLEPQGAGPWAGGRLRQVTHVLYTHHREERTLWGDAINACHHSVCVCVCLFCRRQVNWREAKGEEEINIYQSERRRRTIHSLPKESRVSELTHRRTQTHTQLYTNIIVWRKYHYFSPITNLFMIEISCFLLNCYSVSARIIISSDFVHRRSIWRQSV